MKKKEVNEFPWQQASSATTTQSDSFSIEKGEVEKHPVSTAQQRLLQLYEQDSGNTDFNVSATVHLSGDIDLDILQKSFNLVVKRHPSLRTTYEFSGSKSVKIINDGSDSAMKILDWRAQSSQERHRSIQHINALAQPFDLKCGPVIRVKLIWLDSNKEAILYLEASHIAVDSKSLRYILDDLTFFYHQFVSGYGNKICLLPVDYEDYTSWMKITQHTESYQEALEYWKKELTNTPQMLHLPTDMSRNVEPFKGAIYRFNIPQKIRSEVEAFAKKNQCTAFAVLITAYAILLNKYSRDTRINIGGPSSGLPRTEIKKMVGLFQNSTVFCNDFIEDQNFLELLQHNIEIMWESNKHLIAFEDMVERLSVPVDSSCHPIYQVSFNLHEKVFQHWQAGSVKFETIDVNSGYNNLDISLDVLEINSEYFARIKYNANLFTEQSIGRFCKHYVRLLKLLMAQPSLNLSEIVLLTKDERELVLKEWNDNDQDFPLNKSVVDLFEETVNVNPDGIALVYDGFKLTYSDLNKKVNQLAWYLLQFKLQPGELVGVCLPRSHNIVIAELAIMKAGAAFLPLDPTLPPERLRYIVEDSHCQCLVTLEQLSSLILSFSGDTICMDRDENLINQQNHSNLELYFSSDNLAYVIYTSGSTGNPKGVLIEHKSLTNFLLATQQVPGLQQDDVVLALATISFDVAIMELFLPLVCGASVVIAPDAARQDTFLLMKVMKKENVTMMVATPTTWMMLLASGWQGEKNFTAISAAETLSPQLARRLAGKCRALWNGYGPTEATCGSSFVKIHKGEKVITIGQALANKKYYILDEKLKPVPIGVPGELCIGGVGLARGYLNRPELTNKSFVPDPFRENSDSRIYRTGDLCCWLADGRVEFLERVDHQVKIRGYRIELGEIEAKLSSYIGVKQAVVLVEEKTSGDKFLVAYFVSTDKVSHSKSEWHKILSSYLKSFLPTYMIPEVFMPLDKFPATINGKLDKSALPKVEYETVEDYVAPKTLLQRKIVAVWSNVLNIPEKKIGVSTNFFLLGGNSLSMVMMFNALRSLLKKEPNSTEFLSSPTVQVLAEQLSDSGFDIKSASHPELITAIRADIDEMDNITALPQVNEYTFKPRAVLMTGACGFLGSYLVKSVFDGTNADIYCLIRAETLTVAESKLQEAFRKSGHGELIKSDRVKVILGDLKQARLGIEESSYNRLAAAVDVIYHCGALVHHLYDYERLRSSNVKSTLELLSFATTAQNKAIHYISSIATKGIVFNRQNYQNNTDWSGFAGNGYVLSKWVNEQLLSLAAEKGIHAKVYRPGNIAGDSNTGYCNYQHNHILLKLKGMLQLKEGYISKNDIIEMVPVDLLADDIVSKSLDAADTRLRYNCQNPHTISWLSFLQAYEAHGFNVHYFHDLDRWHHIIENLPISNAMFPLLELYRSGHIQEESKFLNSHSDFQAKLPSYNHMIDQQFRYLADSGFFADLTDFKT